MKAVILLSTLRYTCFSFSFKLWRFASVSEFKYNQKVETLTQNSLHCIFASDIVFICACGIYLLNYRFTVTGKKFPVFF